MMSELPETSLDFIETDSDIGDEAQSLATIDSTPAAPRTITEETVWFVFRGEGYDGPLSFHDVRERVETGEILRSTFIWTEGMQDWESFEDVTELQELLYQAQLAGPLTSALPTLSETAEFIENSVGASSRPANEGVETDSGIAQHEASRDMVWDEVAKSALHQAQAATAAPIQTIQNPYSSNIHADFDFSRFGPTPLEKKRQRIEFLRRYRLPLSVALALVVGLSGLVAQNSLRTNAIPANEVSASDYAELQRATSQNLRLSGPSAAFAMAVTGLEAPRFYIASNLQDGEKLEMRVDGVPETLVGRLYHSVQTTVTVRDHVAVTPSLATVGPDGSILLAKGEYLISIRDLANSRVLAQKRFFLGGSPDANYRPQLQAYHGQLWNQATAEVMELRQLAETVSHLLGETSTRYSELIEGGPHDLVARRAQWSAFHAKWSRLAGQVQELMKDWSPASMNSRFFYTDTYRALKQAQESMQRTHFAQDSAVSSIVELASTRATIASETASALLKLQAIRQYTEKLELELTKGGDTSRFPPRPEFNVQN